MNVTVNGETQALSDGATVGDLLGALGLGEKWVLVEVNGEPVPRGIIPSARLKDGDRVELVRAVAGG